MSFVWWWRDPESNWGHKAFQASALPAELSRHVQSINFQAGFFVKPKLCFCVYFLKLSLFRLAFLVDVTMEASTGIPLYLFALKAFSN